MDATALKNTAGQHGDPDPVQRRLEGLCDRARAAAAVLCVAADGKLRVIARAPANLVATRDILVAITAALRSGKAATRLPAKGAAAPVALVALRTRFKRQAAVVGFVFEGADDLQALLAQAIASTNARRLDEATQVHRANDRTAKVGRAASVPARSVTPVGGARVASPRPAQSHPASISVANRPDPLEAAGASRTATFSANLELSRSQGAALAALAGVLDFRDVTESLHALADNVAQHWCCQRVSVGIVEQQQVVVTAISGSAEWQKQSALVTDIAEAMAETRVAASTQYLPSEKDEPPPRAHQALARQLKDPALLSLPLVDHGEVAGVLLLEREYRFDAADRERLEQLGVLLGPVVALKRESALRYRDLVARVLRRTLGAVFGPRHLTRKLCGLAAALALISATTVHGTFRVTADAQIEATAQRSVVASFDSYLTDVQQRAGDLVEAGQVLATLDTQDLMLERVRWEGERDKLIKEYRALLAQRDRSNLRVVEAKRDQAQAQIDLIDAQLERAVVRAPIDGVVVSGDLSQMLGSPVERGELLFEVAALGDYRLALMVDESDIGWVELGTRGILRLRSHPDRDIEFTVSAITPVSEPGDGANVFRVEAEPDGLPATLRPGMVGVAKIEIGERAYGWIFGHKAYHWLRLKLWQRGL